MANEGNEPAAAADANASKPIHVMELLKQFDFLSIGLNGKIQCALTNRDLPLNTVAIQQHLNSKKLKKEREWYNADFSKYEPLIVAHKTNPKLLFCTLTLKELNRIPKQVEAHVNGKRFRNRKAEMEGLKQGERQPRGEESEEEEGEEEEEEEEEEEGGADFWVPAGGAEVEAMEEDSDESDEEEKDKEAEEKTGTAGGHAPRGGKARGVNKAGAQAGKDSKGGGKGDKTRKTKKGERKDGGDGARGNGASGAKDAKGKAEKKGGSKKSKQRAGKKEAGKPPATKSGKSAPLADDTPAVSNTVTKEKDADAPTALPSPSAKVKAKKKAKSPKKKAKGGETPEGKGAVGGASPVAVAKSVAKRKHKVSEEPASSGKKKRKA